MKKVLASLDRGLFTTSLIFFVLGALNIMTASSSEALAIGKTIYYYFLRQSFFITLGYFVFLIIINTPTSKYKGIATILYIVFIVILFYLLIGGEAHRGAKNWITIMGVTFQPSEFMKPITIVLLALLFDTYQKELKLIKSDDKNVIYTMIGVVGILAPLIIFLQDDFGSMSILLIIFIGMFMASPGLKKDKWKLTMYAVVAGILGILIIYSARGSILSKAQMNRFNFFNPCSRYEYGGYQVCNGIIAINNGNIAGKGIGKSTQKYSYIPEAHTDSVFAILVEEYGLFNVTVILIFLVYILKRIFTISSEAVTLRGRYISLGVGIYISIHIILNLGGLTASMPLTGVPLPFFSYGGSFAFNLVVSLGLVQRVHIENQIYKENKLLK
jgi:cell division protein FtsW